MQIGIRTIAAAALVALLVPVAAVAKDARVKGPTAIAGAGYFGGELELAIEDGQRPVRILGGAGYLGVLDVAGDLQLRCPGKGRVQKHETRNGTVHRCAGRQGGQIVLLGSHVVFRGFLTRYRMQVPTGAAGTFHGRFVVQDEARGGAPKRPQPAPARDEEEIPSLEELAAMLDDA
jgi:hypothetical protein